MHVATNIYPPISISSSRFSRFLNPSSLIDEEINYAEYRSHRFSLMDSRLASFFSRV